MKTTLAALAVSALALAACGQSSNEAARENAAIEGRPAGTETTMTTENGMGSTTAPGMTPDASTDSRTEGGLADPGMSGSSPTATVATRSMTPQDYVASAVSGDQFEIQSSQLMLQRSKNDAVTRFAKMMVTDHRASTGQMTKAAGQANLVAPRFELMAKHQALLDTLRQAGNNADQVYLEQQRAAHAEAIAMHRSMANNTSAPEQLSALAKELLPKVEAHARMLADIKGTGTGAGAGTTSTIGR